MVSLDIKAFESLIKNESSACKYLQRLCWKNYRRFCIRCRGYKIYSLSDKRYRCKRCGYTFSDFSRRWINRLRIDKRDWLYLIKFFELEVSARRASKETKLSYPTVLNGYNLIRSAILAHHKDWSLLKGEIKNR
jgi:transposase